MSKLRLKHWVSKQKRRLQEDGFDLDLTYIKPHIVAMGFPAEKIEGLYRNSLDEVVRFLDTKHRDHYRVYNLCSERYYDPGKFHGRVAMFPFEDHNAPPFELIKPFCVDMAEWFARSPKNVAIVHCKAGKGRTGVMICAYLLYNREFQTTEDALQFYGEARTKNQKGVTIPSQRRYVYYFGHLLRKGQEYSIKTLLLKGFRFEGIPNFFSSMGHMQGCSVSFVIRLGNTKIHTSKVHDLKRGESNGEIMLDQDVPLCGDIKIEFYHNYRLGKEKLCQFWFNTFFVDMHLEMQRESEKQEAEQQSASANGHTKTREPKPITSQPPPTSKGHRSRVKRSSREMPDMPNAALQSSRANGPSSPGEDPGEVLGACAQVKPEMIDIYFPQDELEKANKDKKHFPAGFKLHVLLSNVGHQCSDGPAPITTTTVPPEDTQSQVEPWNEDDDNLSDTDSESEWNNTGPGPVTQV